MERKKIINFLKSTLRLSTLAIFGVLIFAFFVFTKRNDFFDRFFYELKRPFTWDTTMYYAIGKGFSHGLKPYVDMFETKPPMIFFMASLSYSLTGDYYLCNFLSFTFLILTTLSPLIMLVVLMVKRKERNIYLYIIFGLSALMVGMLLGGYLQLRSGEVQVELFGSFFVLAYILTARGIDVEKAKFYSPLIIVSALFLMIGVMFKEPFILIAFACAMIVCKNPKEWFYRFILPCVYGGLMGVVLLLFTGTLIPYLTVYLPHMMGNHISIYGSPFERMKKIEKLLNDMGGYSAIFLGVIITSALGVVVKIFFEKEGNNQLIQRVIYTITRILRVVLIPFILSFTVGLGGQYYNHHYIFALPCYTLCVITLFEDIYLFVSQKSQSESKSENDIISNIKKVAVGIVCSLAVVGLLGIYLLPQPRYDHYEKILSLSKTMKDDAKYVDEVLDVLGEETYQYFGFNGPVFYCYTEHDPKGPVFFQDPNNLQKEDNFFATNLKKQMEETDIYIVSNIKCGVVTDYVNEYIAKNFELIQNSDEYELVKDIEKPKTFNYKIYVRKN